MASPQPARRPSPALRLLLAAPLLACGTGCTSALSTAYLREAFWETAEHAAETAPDAEPDIGAVAEPIGAEADGERRQAAVDEATARLAKLGELDEATRSSLVETLHRTQQEDWPAVVEAFATSLQASSPQPRSTGAPVEESETHVVAKADLDQATAPAAVTTAVTSAPAADAGDPLAVPAEAPVPSQPPEPEAPPVSLPTAPQPLAVQSACFASRVQGWGLVERFTTDRFRPGQEVIVYFELDNLSAGASAAGHTTCIDTELRLVAADGSPIKAWSFEPIAETCRLPRHDYFARYVVTIPAEAPVGGGRLELVVTDTLAGNTARATLPLEIAAAD